MDHPSDSWLASEREETGIYNSDQIESLYDTDVWHACPWWIEYPKGEYPKSETELWKRM